MKNLNKNETGFTLIELLVVVVIVGISAAVATPSLVGSWRQNRANQVFSQLVSALQSAQANANRLSTTCTVNVNVTVTTIQVTAAPVGCLQESVNFNSTNGPIDSAIINGVNINSNTSVTNSFNGSVAFTFNGTATATTTWFVARKDGNTVSTSNANCVVINQLLGFIRTGKYNTSNNTCENIANLQYPN